ncbi:PAQR family membrane homeostasis protein TrhA [Caproicibacter sp.]|uniref:PAQR family membrane homeostasis protein TrhA n=1 Tax=Caproicibacter sp. TaxID=2814884 RepID=UPI003989E816
MEKNAGQTRCKLSREELQLPSYTALEEILNAVTHGLGVLFAIAGLILLLINCRRDAVTLISVSIFGGTMILLYLVSTLYHGMGVCRGKQILRILDHCTIFLLISGTYTPVSLLCFGGTTGWVLFAIVWGVSVVGIVLNAISVQRFRVFSMCCYLGLGWVVIFFFKPLIAVLDAGSVRNLIVGGVFYTVGAVLYGIGKKRKYIHSVWHLFVLAGSVFHYFVVYRIALPM